MNNFSEKAKTCVDQFLVAGDFNSHFSKTADVEFGIAGSRGLKDTPSARRAYQMVEFMASQWIGILLVIAEGRGGMPATKSGMKMMFF